MNNISVFIEVYNESHRLESCLKCFTWADELVVFVKESTDNTFEIAKQYATHVYAVPYCEGSENVVMNLKKHDFKEWIMFITASSLIDPDLVDEVIKLTSNPTSDYDIIGLPYNMYVMGVTGNKSPWSIPYKYPLVKKSIVQVCDKLHCEISYNSTLIYRIPHDSVKGRFYHLTHYSPEDMFMRHIRYVKYETHWNMLKSDNVYENAFYQLLQSVWYVIKHGIVFRGRKGFIMSISYVSYWAMLLINTWYAKYGLPDIYSDIRKVNLKKWSIYHRDK